jgi:hypothetical protein
MKRSKFTDSQIIVVADVIGSGSEQSMLIPMVGQAQDYLALQTIISADAVFFKDANVQALCDRGESFHSTSKNQSHNAVAIVLFGAQHRKNSAEPLKSGLSKPSLV